MRRTPLLEGEIDWKSLMQMTDADLNKPDTEYEFSNGRTFKERRPGGTLYDTTSYDPAPPDEPA